MRSKYIYLDYMFNMKEIMFFISFLLRLKIYIYWSITTLIFLSIKLPIYIKIQFFMNGYSSNLDTQAIWSEINVYTL